jgi:hypothetical protein
LWSPFAAGGAARALTSPYVNKIGLSPVTKNRWMMVTGPIVLIARE